MRKLVAISLFLSSAFAGLVQIPGLKLPPSAIGQREAVKGIFVKSYEGYRKFAFGHDDLDPVSFFFSDGRNGWGASIVDAMSTMVRF